MRVALSRAQRAAERREKNLLCQVNESIQPVVDAFMAWVCDEERIVLKTRASLVGAFQRKLAYLKSPELIEELADSEHDRWARWHKHLRKHMDEPGRMERWDRLAETPYADLDEPTKEWDRIEARRTQDIFMEYLSGRGSGDPSILRAEPMDAALLDVIAELNKQEEKWGPDHDDEDHEKGDLLQAGVEVATDSPSWTNWVSELRKKHSWRERLVIGAALIISEIRRHDRGANDD